MGWLGEYVRELDHNFSVTLDEVARVAPYPILNLSVTVLRVLKVDIRVEAAKTEHQISHCFEPDVCWAF